MSTWGIKKAEARDAPDLDRIISKEFAYKQLSKEKIEERLKRQDIEVYKKTIDDKLAGFVEIQLFGEIGMVNALSVKEEHRRKGFGKELLNYAVDALREKGAKTARLLVMAGNAKAKRLYGACGFESTGLHERKIGGSEVEVWEKRIPEAESGYLN